MYTAAPFPSYRLRFAGLALAFALTGCAVAPASAPVQAAAPPAPSPTPSPPPSSAGAASAQAPDSDAALQAGFVRWVAAMRASALAAGIDDTTVHSAFDDVHYLPRVVELDGRQPEFNRAVWDYLDTAVSPQRVTRGQDKLLQVRTEADAAAARYGVPASVVVAIWGMESN
ncbi:MAG: lytic murein transglycosylase, partial [Pseudomonadota bacterium]